MTNTSGPKLTGVITALVTPFREDGSVDLEMLEELVEFQINHGVKGLYPIGTTGEGLLLTPEEKRNVIKKVIEVVDGRIKVIPQVGSLTLQETVDLGLFARDCGADGVGLLPPFYYTIPAEGITDYFITVAKVLDPLPAALYNIPTNAKNSVTVQITKAVVAQAPNVIGIKDTSKDLGLFESFISTMGPDFAVIVGADALFYASLAVGGSGTVTAAGNAYPELFVQLYDAFQSGDWESARMLQYRINEVRAIIKAGPPLASYKAVLNLRGVKVGGMRRPFRDVTSQEMEMLDSRLHEIGAL
jgi:4-hydroxy-tetrahydrodipicolinate synthase